MDQQFIRNSVLSRISIMGSRLWQIGFGRDGDGREAENEGAALDQMDLGAGARHYDKLQPVRMEYEYSGTGTRQRTTNNEQYKRIATNNQQSMGSRN